MNPTLNGNDLGAIATSRSLWLGALCVLWGAFAGIAHGSEAQRSMSVLYQPGDSINVQISVHPDGLIRAYLLQDILPPGWVASQITLGGVWSVADGVIRWGPFLDNSERVLAYRATSPKTAAPSALFQGTAVFDSLATPVVGVSILSPFPDTLTQALPAEFEPGVALRATTVAVPRRDVADFEVEQEIPEGWSATDISDEGVFDVLSRKVKWGPFQDARERALGFTFIPSKASASEVESRALGRFDLRTVRGAGSQVLKMKRRSVTRVLPGAFGPDQAVTVQIRLAPLFLDDMWAVEETIPAGWRFISGAPAPVVDAIRRKLKWGPAASVGPQTFTYQLRAPSNSISTAVFTGISSFDQETFSVAGDSVLEPATASASRSLPAHYQPGRPLEVSIQVSPSASVSSYGLQETVPPGWTARAIGSDGAFDLSSRTLRWGPFLSQASRLLTYEAIPPADAYGEAVFEGRASFDGADKPVSGNVAAIATHQIIRVMSADFRAGLPGKSIVLHVLPLEGVEGQAVQETVPAGWTLASVSQGGVFSARDRTLRWGPFLDAIARDLSYTVVAPFLAEDQAEFVGFGVFDRRVIRVEGPSVATRTLNLPPVALPISFDAGIAQTTLLRIEQILARCADPDGGTFSIALLSDRSDSGAQLSISSGGLSYTSFAGQTGRDRLTCLVSDSQGGVTAAEIQVNLLARQVTPPPRVLAMTRLPDGSFKITFAGVPMTTYRTESSNTLYPASWAVRDYSTADGSGWFEVIDAQTRSVSSRFYRTAPAE